MDTALEGASHNYPLPDRAYVAVLKLHSDLKNEMRDLEGRIQSLMSKPGHPRNRPQTQRELQSIRSERRRKFEQAEQCRTVLAPHRRLPDELLLAIFLNFTADSSVSIPWKIHEAPWVITRVCARWRRIVLGVPMCWTNVAIHFCDDDRPGFDDDTVASMLREILMRSGNEPFSLSIVGPAADSGVQGSEEEEEEATLALPFQSLTCHLRRLRSLRISSLSRKHLSFLFKADLPSLEYVRITDTSRRAYTGGFDLSLLGVAPSLREIVLYDRPLQVNLLGLPLRQLTVLKIWKSFSPSELLVTLSQCPSLVECEIFLGRGIDPSDSLLPDVVDLPSLTHLSVYRVLRHDEPDSILLKSLSLPKLQHLTLRATNCDAFLAWVPSILKTGGLRTLAVHHLGLHPSGQTSSISSDILQSLLEHTPQLTTLILEPGFTLPHVPLKKAVRRELTPHLSDLHVIAGDVFIEKIFGDLLSKLDHWTLELGTKLGNAHVFLVSRDAPYVETFSEMLKPRRLERLREYGWSVSLKEASPEATPNWWEYRW